ncbi:MAG: flagellar motor protein MotB [Lachnospiraceae bacterium]|nr:flagellar motor protein MotB [Lachnospiraceae bacterium]
MAKRKEEEPPKGAPAWQSTFADLMNLLLCFFVMLFAMSTIDAEKFALVAASFSQTFSIFDSGGSSLLEGLLINNGVSQLSQLDEYMNTMGQAAESDVESDEFKEFDEKVSDVQQEMLKQNEELAEKIEEAVAEQNLQGDIDVDFTSQYVELTLNGALLFDSGKSELKAEALPLMEKVGVILQKYAESIIEVEGHTDNVPIHTARFANNNELSSARALSVFDYLVEHTNLIPANIKHSGRGEYIPVADNSTPEGRAKNRRVEIKIYNPLAAP